MAAHPGPNVPHATPRKKALEYGKPEHFEGALPYDPAAGTPSNQSGGTYSEEIAHQAHKHAGKPSPGGKPFALK